MNRSEPLIFMGTVSKDRLLIGLLKNGLDGASQKAEAAPEAAPVLGFHAEATSPDADGCADAKPMTPDLQAPGAAPRSLGDLGSNRLQADLPRICSIQGPPAWARPSIRRAAFSSWLDRLA